jgi:hypothetical protein
MEGRRKKIEEKENKKERKNTSFSYRLVHPHVWSGDQVDMQGKLNATHYARSKTTLHFE